MSEAIDLFTQRAREVTIAQAAPLLGLVPKGRGAEQVMACPRCGGKDRFSFNTAKNAWNCRGASVGGRDAIGMAAHVLGLDVARKPEFLEACAAVLGEAVPDAGERITPERRAEMAAEAEARRVQAEAQAAERARQADDFRERELMRCRGIYEAALACDRAPALEYLQRRTGLAAGLAERHCPAIRFEPKLTYWHGKDARGFARDIWCGPAMVLPFVDAAGAVIGIHQTWICLDAAPKYRPALYGVTRAGIEAGHEDRAGVPSAHWPRSCDLDDGLCERLATKKMRGTKTGGLLPLAGARASARWVVAEGLENVAAWFAAEFADDPDLAARSFYCAAGDIGNLAGPPARTGRFGHPVETRADARGRVRPVMMPSPEPDPERLHEGFPLGAHVREILFLGDGDSEPVWTAAQMARAEARARLIAPGVEVATAWPPRGHDWAEVILAAIMPGAIMTGVEAQ